MPASAGLVMAFNTETEVLEADAAAVRQETPIYREYEIAGAPHFPKNLLVLYENQDATIGIPDTDTADPLAWLPVTRALFSRLDRWASEGQAPPASAWLGAPNDPAIARDANGNALGGIRLPDVAVGRGVYIAFASEYFDKFSQFGGFGYIFRAIAGDFVDLAGNFSQHGKYVSGVAHQATKLVESGYLLREDAEAIESAAAQSKIGK
jgi:hypothetical protein